MEAAGPSLPYATAYHAPVLCKTVVEGLVTDPAGLYVDATLGGGGHAAALLDALAPAGRVLGVDRDAEAIAAATARLDADAKARRFRTVRGSFGELDLLLDRAGVDLMDGLLLDLGVSSHQFDAAKRGFSHRFAGPLDMRMDQRAKTTAATVVNTWKEADLVQLFFEAGEEPRSRRIVRAIVSARPVPTTEALAAIVRRSVPNLEEAKSLARVFQALRIAVNDELDALEAVLATAVQRIKPGGRVAVLSYHSLEDRRVKRYLRYGNFEGRPHRDVFGNLVAPFKEVTRQALVPSEEEIAANPRARSAKLRIAERLG